MLITLFLVAASVFCGIKAKDETGTDKVILIALSVACAAGVLGPLIR